MKLIHIFVIAAAMTAVSRAQNATPADANGKPQTVASNASNKPSAAIAANTLNINMPAASAPGTVNPANYQDPATKPGAQSTSKGKAPAPVVTGKPPAPAAVPSKTTTKSTAKTAKTAAPKKSAKPKGPQVAKNNKPPANGATAPAPLLEGAHGRRDPFISAIRTANPSTPTGPACATGKRCLSIPELTLHGIVKDATGKMMALVVTPTNRMYILRESDQVFNGSVVKITADSVIFREFTTDKLGHEVPHEVVKKLTVGS